MKLSSFVIITGMSGSGKGTFLRALEDRGYFCVDNLPVGLLGKFHELSINSEGQASRSAMVIDVRGEGLGELPGVLSALRKSSGVETTLWFLDSTDAALIRRFSETRRPHPLNPAQSVLESITQERELLAPIRALADHVLDTSQFTLHDLRKHVISLFGDEGGHLQVSVVSFGFKYGLPIDSDLVLDVRFLPNPNFVPELKNQTGADADVIAYMNAQEATGEFSEQLFKFIDFLLPQYEKEGKAYVTISIGCTGGRHRSVFITNALAAHVKAKDYQVKVSHRDSDKAG